MLKARRQAGATVLIGAGAFALAFAQRPGWATADTKINLHVDPGRFVSDVASMWTSTGQLGAVQTGQQAGYLFPMGPFFALGHAVGLADWVVQRLWLGTVLALAGWGAMRLVAALLGRPTALAQLVAGAVTLCNPFVVTYANRTTVTFLAYAALPWLMLAVHRSLHDSRGWRWPAVVALLVTASGGGINGAVTAWMLLGPVLLLLYEPFATEIGWDEVRAFLVRAIPLTALACLWWVVPAYVQSSYGINFLHFTEQPGTVWGTTSVTESLRLMSFWLSYVGIGFAGAPLQYFDDSRTLLFSAPVVTASLLLPALALGGFVWTRRWRYGPFFLGLALVAVLIMGAGFPEGTPLRHGLHFTYNHVTAVQFLRASYKAAPLLALALAALAGAAAGEAWRRLEAAPRAIWWRSGAVLAGVAVLALAAWPLVTGRAQDAQVSYRQIPVAWRAAAADLDRGLPANSRAIVLPGDLFSFYRWGGTVDPILPALSRRPVAERSEVPYSDLRATDLLWTIDRLVHQQRLLPGQLSPLLSLIGVRSVIVGSDDDLARSDAPAPADAAAELASQPGFASPARSYGPVRSFTPTGVGPAVKLPEVRRFDLRSSRGLVQIEPRSAPTVVDGSADALAGLAAVHALPADHALLYAGDLSQTQLRSDLGGGGQLVISDSNRRQAFVAGSLEQNLGPVLTPGQTVSADGYVFNEFGRGSDFETVAAYSGVRSVQAPSSPQVTQFPEHAPFAAIDGSSATAWLADPTLGVAGRWLQVDFERPRAVPYVDLLPYDDAGASVRQVEIGGRRFDVHPGFNRLELGLRRVADLRVSLIGVSGPRPGAVAGAGGISELRIPGVRASEALRLPVDAARALSGRNLDRVALTYLFQRTTGDDPYQRDLAHGPFSAADPRQPGDAEQTMRRVFELPAVRRFGVSAWVNAFPHTPDDTLDRLVGYRGPVQATSASRFDGEPQWRASQALDGNPATAWIGDYDPAVSVPWLQLRAARPFSVSALRLRAAAQPVRRPTQVRLTWPGGSTPALPVGSGGVVVLPHQVRTRGLRIEILRAIAPTGASAADQRAVGIAEVGGLGGQAGLPRVNAPPTGKFAAPCGSVRVQVGESVVALRVQGSAGAFARGAPLLAASCGAPVALRAGVNSVAVAPGPFAVDELRLSSAAPIPGGVTLRTGRVIDSGISGHGSYDHVRVSVTRPSWLVLGEGYNRGWSAYCNGRSLGAPSPIDGYANGWPVGAGCRRVRFAFAPNRLAEIGYVISGLAGLVCLVLLLFGTWRWRRRPPAETLDTGLPAPGVPLPWPPGRALPVALGAAIAFGFVFGIVPGVLSLPAIALILWRGIGARALTLAATVLLAIVVPLLYVIHPGDERGGNHFGYAMAHLAAHYVGVAALGLLMGALWLTLRGQSARRRSGRAGHRRAGSPEA